MPDPESKELERSVVRRVEDKIFPGKAVSMSPYGTGLGSRYLVLSLTHKMNGKCSGTRGKKTDKLVKKN